MKSPAPSIARNATSLLASQLVSWVLTLILTLFLPRFLGARAVGQFHLANSLWAIVAIFIIFGMDRHLTKEIARDSDSVEELLSVSLLARTILYVVGFAILALVLQFLDYPAETVQVILILGVGQILWQYVSAATAVLQGIEQMQYISIGTVAGKVFNTAVAVALLLLGYGVLAIAVVTIGAALVNLIVVFRYLRRFVRVRLSFSLGKSVAMLRLSSSYLFTRFAMIVYQQVDIIIISLLVNEVTIGWYGAADQLFGTLLFIPTVFMTAVFPALSRLYTSDQGGLHRLMGRSFNLLLLLSVPIGFGLIAISNSLVVLLFGPEFANSGPVLALFGVVLLLTYQNMLIGQFLVSTDRQNRWTVVLIAATLLTIPLDLILIPWCVARFGNGALGGALAFVVTELMMLVVGLMLLPRQALGWAQARTAARVVLAGLVMTLVIWPIKDLFVALPVLAGGAVYGLAIWLLRVVPESEMLLVRQARDRVLGRLLHRAEIGSV